MAATVYARPEDWAAALDELERTGRVAGQEAQWRRSDGGQFWASLAMNRVSDASGSSHFEGTVLDVSERKEAEQELARYRDHLEEMVQERTRDLAAAKRKMEELHALQGLILDNSQAGIALVKDRAFEWANARWAAILGREQQDLENASTRLLYPDDATYEMVGRESLEALRQGRAWDREVELVRADGTPFWGRLIGSSLVPGEPDQGIIWLLEDVTERHAMEEKLRQRQRRLTEALQSLKRAQRELGEKNAALESVSGQLAKYLPPQVYTSIFAGHQEAQVGATRKKLTVFFSDIVGFTSATDGMEPEDITTALNAYLNAMSRIVLDHGGTLDKFIGDAIMVFFGDPESQGYKEDAVACVSMALAMRSSLKGLQAYWNELGVRHPFHVRMGISTGYCTVGNFGSDQRMDYTIIGGQVNLASRLESMAGPGQVLISHETWSLVKDVFHCVRKDPVSVKGIAQPVQTYEVVDFHENIKTEKKKIKDHRTGFTLSMRPERIAEEDREDILAVLREAMESLDKE
jgi:PAS domain S-box-containing protein